MGAPSDPMLRNARLTKTAAANKAPTAGDASIQAAGEAARLAAANAIGRASTILTGGLGDLSTPQLQKKTLLGA